MGIVPMENDDLIKRIRDICQTTTNPRDEESRINLAREFEGIVDKLDLDLSDPVETFPGAFNPFFGACQVGNIPIVKVFINRGATLNILDSHGRSPLVLAIASRNNGKKVISSLLQLGAKIDFSSDDKSPLLASFYNLKREVATLLLRRGADVNSVMLPCFCFVESVFSLHSNLVMMASGHRLQLTSFLELVALSTEIVLAGLHPRTFYLSAKRVMFEHFTRAELHALWKFQHLCLVLNFRVEGRSLDTTIRDVEDMIGGETTTDRSKVKWMAERRDRLLWIKEFQSKPLPLTYLSRIAIRSHLSSPHVGRQLSHVNDKIETLPLPNMCLDFLKVKSCDIREVRDFMTV